MKKKYINQEFVGSQSITVQEARYYGSTLIIMPSLVPGDALMLRRVSTKISVGHGIDPIGHGWGVELGYSTRALGSPEIGSSGQSLQDSAFTVGLIAFNGPYSDQGMFNTGNNSGWLDFESKGTTNVHPVGVLKRVPMTRLYFNYIDAGLGIGNCVFNISVLYDIVTLTSSEQISFSQYLQG